MLSSQFANQYSTDWHLGTQRRRRLALTMGAVAACGVLAAIVLAAQFVSVAVLLTWVVVTSVAWRARVGFYVVLGIACLFESTSLDALMLPGVYLNGDVSNSFQIPGVIFSPVELLMLLSVSIWLVKGLVYHNLNFQVGRLGRPMLLFCAFLVLGFVRGVVTGGLVNIALWESRFLFYMVLWYVLATNTLHTQRQVRAVTIIFIVASTLFAIEGAYRRFALIDAGQLGDVKEFWYAHEDVVFLGSLLLLIIAQQALGAPGWMRWLGFVLIGVVGYTLLASERRAGYIGVMVGFLGLTLAFYRAHRRAFVSVSLPLILAMLVYLPIFWNASGLVAQPARAVRSLRDPDPRDAQSNLSRDLEKMNIRATIASNPLLGVGFGQTYHMVVGMPDISFFPFWQYETHANVLWVWLKTGAVGFTVFLVLMGSALARAGNLFARLRTPEARVFALFAIGVVLTSISFCYVDLGLTSGRIPILLGSALGTLDVLDRVYS